MRDIDNRMDGMSVFSFGLSAVPKSIKKLIEHFHIEIDDVDFFLFHQANLFMNEKIREKDIQALYKKVKADEDKCLKEDETLRKHMLDICEALVGLETSDATHVFGSPDDVKLHSSMTLFKAACPDIDIFQKVIDKFFAGKDDRRTIEIISWKQQ